MQVPVRELKAHLSEYLHRARDGEEVLVTSHGRPVARLMPLESPPSAGEDAEAAAVARILALPSVRPGKGGPPRGIDNPVEIAPGEKTLAEIVGEQRG